MRTHVFCLANTVVSTAVFLFAPGIWPVVAVLYLAGASMLAHKTTHL